MSNGLNRQYTRPATLSSRQLVLKNLNIAHGIAAASRSKLLTYFIAMAIQQAKEELRDQSANQNSKHNLDTTYS